HLAIIPGVTAFERERCQIDSCFLPQFDKCEPDIRVMMEMLPRYLVEDRCATEVVAPFEEEPDEGPELLRRSHRIAQGHPRASLHAVHDERRSPLIEQQR